MSWCGSLVLLLPGLFRGTSEEAGSFGQLPANYEVGVTQCRAGAGWIGGVTYVVRVGAALVGLAAAGLLAARGGHPTAGTSGGGPGPSRFPAKSPRLRP